MPFTIAIVGRPNVGKSTLFNRLAGKRLALVDDQPVLTRDRRDADTELGTTAVRLIDTAGLEHGDAGLTARMREQTVAAIKQADLVVFLIDARAGVIAADEIFADLVRASGKPVILAANKCEGRAAEPGLYEAFSLGLGEPLPISAEHALGIGELSDAIQQAASSQDGGAQIEEAPGEEDEGTAHPLRIAVVGRPNVGKSTLVNTILGEERLITGPEAGITRDAIAVDLERQGRALRLFDTAGLRRKMRMEGTAEELSVGDTLRAIRFAEVVVLLLDAERPFEKQDLQIADLIFEEGRDSGGTLRRRHPARHQICRSRRAFARCRAALREAGSADRRSHFRGGKGPRHRRQQMGPGASATSAARRVARDLRAPSAADQGRCLRPRLRAYRQGHR